VLQPDADARLATLTASVELQKLQRACEVETSWISEKQAAAGVTDVSGDLPVVALALKAHRSLALDVTGRKARVEAVVETAMAMQKEHYAAAAIESLKEALSAEWTQLLAATERRGQLLEARVRALEYLGRHREASLWIAEKMTSCSSTECVMRASCVCVCVCCAETIYIRLYY
jgi:hypothetical protein